MLGWIKTRSNVFWAIALVVIIAVWVASGALFGGNGGANEKPLFTPSKTPSVAVITPQRKQFQKELSLPGETVGTAAATIVARTNGRVTALYANRGQQVQKGQRLAKLDEGTRRRELASAQATLNAAKAEAKASRELAKDGFESATALAQREANLASAQARVSSLRQDLAYTTVIAPKSGVLDDRMVAVGDTITMGGPLFTLVPDGENSVFAFASQNEIVDIMEGDKATVRLANGKQYPAKVVSVATVASSNTRTYRVELSLSDRFNIPVGMTADVRLKVKKAFATPVPRQAIILNDAGTVGVMTAMPLPPNNDLAETAEAEYAEVRFTPVEILTDNEEGFLIDGLPKGASVVVRGMADITSGTRVRLGEVNL